MQRVGNAVLSALWANRVIQTPKHLLSVHTQRVKSLQLDETDMYITRLRGATVYENNLFIGCVQEIYQRIDNPRYIIQVRNRFRVSYFNVPALLSNNKANAVLMHKYWEHYVAKGTLLFTRNATGRKDLLAARKGSFDYDDKFFERKRAVNKDNWF